MVILIPFLYPYYIKKEDARDILKTQRRLIPFILIASLIVMGIMQFFVAPKILELYKELNEPIPLITQLSSYIIGGIIAVFTLISIYFLATPPNYERLEKILSKYKDGEMIKTREIVDFRYLVLIMFLLGIMVAFMVLSMVTPIYNLTAKYQ